MHTRITKILASVTLALAVLSGLSFLGMGFTHALDDGAVCVETDFWHNAELADRLSTGEGVQESSNVTRLCQDDPSVGQRAADLGIELPWQLMGSLALLLFSRLLDAVLREGRSLTRCRNGSPCSAGSLPSVHCWLPLSSAGRSPGSSTACRRTSARGRHSKGRSCSSSPASRQ
ncbi:hypothetical protein NKH18_28340 [Streptomyces sp. M10(2022)]